MELSHALPEGAEKVHASLRLALEAGMQDHVGVAYSNLVSSALTTRDYDTARTYLDAGRAFCEEHDLRSWGTYLSAWGARVALDEGRWSDAAALAAYVLERTPRSLPHSRFVALLVQGVLAARRGRDDPWPALDESLAIARGTNELQRVGPVAVARAEARWLTGAPERIPEETEAGFALAERTEHRWTLGEIAVWHHRAGLPAPHSDGVPDPVRAELDGETDRAAQFWSERGCRTTPRWCEGPLMPNRTSARVCRCCRSWAPDRQRRSSRDGCATEVPGASGSGPGPRPGRTLAA